MREARPFVIAVVAALGLGAYGFAWFGWPLYLAIGAGALVGTILLVLATSLGDDPAAADAAWREAAPDLAGRGPEAASEGARDGEVRR